MEKRQMTEKEMEQAQLRFEAEQRLEARRVFQRELEIAHELKRMELERIQKPVFQKPSRNQAKAQRKARRKQRGK